MAQITTGIHAVLSNPFIYELFQNIMGAKGGRKRMVANYIRPTPGMRILDLGCGPAQILESLPQHVEYVGYDMSSAYIDAAEKAFGSRGTFHCRLLEEAEVQQLEKFDLVMGIGVLHHLDDTSAETFMRIAKAALKPGGRLLTRDPVYAKGQNPIAKFLISQDRGQNVRDVNGYMALAHSVFEQVKGTLSHQKWIPYTHYTMESVA
jgi:2-polyprenyl-3-methyl-5-hydroxy-6-metoxy-1,4-benzoquinol methylase